MALSESERTFETQEDLRRFLIRCAKNRIISLGRKFRTWHPTDAQEATVRPGHLAPPGPPHAFALRDECQCVIDWMQETPERTEVLAAIDKVIAADERPTTAALSRVIGGSRRKIEALLRRIRKSAATRFTH